MRRRHVFPATKVRGVLLAAARVEAHDARLAEESRRRAGQGHALCAAPMLPQPPQALRSPTAPSPLTQPPPPPPSVVGRGILRLRSFRAWAKLPALARAELHHLRGALRLRVLASGLRKWWGRRTQP